MGGDLFALIAVFNRREPDLTAGAQNIDLHWAVIHDLSAPRLTIYGLRFPSKWENDVSKG